MKRSFLFTALVLALAAATPACGGGAGPDGKPADGAEGQSDGKDPVEELKGLSDGLQKDVDAIFQPLTDAEAAIDAVSKLPETLKAAKAKFDPKALMAQAQKIANGESADVASLKLQGDAQGQVQTAFDKLKAAVDGIKTIDQKATDLMAKIGEAVVKVPALVTKGGAKAKLKASAPFGVSAEDKAKAKADLDTIEGIGKGFAGKVTEWKTKLTDAPAKAKSLTAKMASAFK